MGFGDGYYSIVCYANGKALDGNTSAMTDSAHPRLFLWDHVPHAANHQWELRHVEGKYHMIVNKATGLAIDGNVNVSQIQTTHPVPFMWTPVPSAHNHHWKFDKVDTDTYVIINRANGLALDGNYGGVRQGRPSHPTPFLWVPVHNAHNHRWVFHFHPNASYSSDYSSTSSSISSSSTSSSSTSFSSTSSSSYSSTSSYSSSTTSSSSISSSSSSSSISSPSSYSYSSTSSSSSSSSLSSSSFSFSFSSSSSPSSYSSYSSSTQTRQVVDHNPRSHSHPVDCPICEIYRQIGVDLDVVRKRAIAIHESIKVALRK